MTTRLKNIFFESVSTYAQDSLLTEKLWNEINDRYSKPGRYYHTLSHINSLIKESEEIKDKIADWDVYLFSAFYHDIIYKSTSSKNKEKSAQLAKQRLTEINFPEEKIIKCMSIISATKNHLFTGDSDTNYFTDCDLSILGQNENIYSQYLSQIRKEYSIYPDFIYNKGIKKVISHFLQMDPIFKTSHFFNKYEIQAKTNLNKELSLY